MGPGLQVRRGVMAGGVFVPQGLGGNHQVAQVDVALQGAGAAQADEGGGRHALGRLHHCDGAGGGADAGGHDGHRNIFISAGISDEFPVPAPDIFIEAPGDFLGPGRVAAGQDIGGQFAGETVDVVEAAFRITGNRACDIQIPSTF